MAQIRPCSLAQLVESLDSFGDDQIIYAVPGLQWNSSSPAAIYSLPQDGQVPVQIGDMRYLLEVNTAKDVLDVWQQWRYGREPSLDEKIEAVIYYAENDAYLPAGRCTCQE